MNLVIDTNVIVSALMNTDGIPAGILASVLNGKLKISYDSRIIFEYINVLSREEFSFESKKIKYLINFIESSGEFVNADPAKIQFNDETDKKFYEVYKTGSAKYLITGNLKHFPPDSFIVSPSQFLTILFKG